MPEIFRGPGDSPDCARCPCAIDGKPHRSIKGGGSLNNLAIVGEGPSTEEIHQGWPFVGPSGKLLQLVFDSAGIDRHSIWITNALLCQRPFDKDKLALAVECCRPRLQRELDLVKPTAVCALGSTATHALQLPVRRITDARGTVQDSPLINAPVVTALHPAAILRGGGAGEVSAGKQKMNVDAQMIFLESDVAKAFAIANGIASAPWKDNITLLVEPTFETITQTRSFLTEVATSGILTIDLEWGKDGLITWLGMATANRAVSLYWPHLKDNPSMRIAVTDAGSNANLPKLFHNLQADIEVWEEQISAVNGAVEDTMLMHHAAFPGAAHDLQNVTSQFLLVPPWKAWRGNETKADGKAKAKVERDAVKEVKKSLKRLEHEARNAASANGAKERKRKRVAVHDERNTTAHFLKLLGEQDK